MALNYPQSRRVNLSIHGGQGCSILLVILAYVCRQRRCEALKLLPLFLFPILDYTEASLGPGMRSVTT